MGKNEDEGLQVKHKKEAGSLITGELPQADTNVL